MPIGIYKRTKEHCKNISEAKKGYIVTKKTKSLISKANIGKKRTKKQIENMSKSRKKYFQIHDAPMKGKKFTKDHIEKLRQAKLGTKHSKKTKLKMSKSRKGRKIIFSKKAKENMSLGAIKRLMNGKDNYARGKRGYFYSKKNCKKVYYRSSWELQAYKILELMKEVKNYFIEPLRIPYLFNGTIHNYLPDILIKYKNGIKELIEIKPKFKLQDKKTIYKLNAGMQYALANNIKFNIWDNDYLLKDEN